MSRVQQPIISVIIPTYKGSTLIGEALESVRAQTYQQIETIVVDDNGRGTEEQMATEKCISRFQDMRLKYIAHEKNRNGAAARNTGIKAAEGDIISFLDDDDLYLPTHLEQCLEALSGDEQAQGVLSGVLYERNGTLVDCDLPSSNDMYHQLLVHRSGLFTGSNLFLTRTAVRETGLFDESFRRFQDVEYMIRFYRKYNMVDSSWFTIVKRDNGGANVPDYDRHVRLYDHFLSKFEEDIQALPDHLRKELLQGVSLNLLDNAIMQGDREGIRKAAERSGGFGTLPWKRKVKCIAVYMHLSGLLNHLISKKQSISLDPKEITDRLQRVDAEYLHSVLGAADRS